MTQHNVTNQASVHMVNSQQIIMAIAERVYGNRSQEQHAKPRYLEFSGAKEYQRYIYENFRHIVDISPFEYISKTDSGWLMINDHRPEIAARISLLIERYGIGVGMMVLHAHQMRWQHIPLEIQIDGRNKTLVEDTSRIKGTRGENVIHVPARVVRSDFDKLAELNIIKPRKLWEESQIVSHEGDRFPCFYCSSGEINPSEVVVNIEGARLGLSRNYSLGFTFAPFGNPLSVIHFLAWDHAKNPFNMNRVPMTVSDLVEMTRQINLSIVNFFACTGIKEYPTIDGVSNGWAGNSIYHQHFQFFQPEYESPIISSNLEFPEPVLGRDDVTIRRLSWETPVYKISADEAINVGLVGNDLAGIWRLHGGAQKVPYKEFPDGYIAEQGEKVPVHTQNIYVPGQNLGKTVYILLRDIRHVAFKPRATDYVNRQAKRLAQGKSNIGVLEATGTMIVDDQKSFLEMVHWQPHDVSRQIDMMVAAVRPEPSKTVKFEKDIKELFPQ